MPQRNIAIISTLDTKIESVLFLEEIVNEFGCNSILIDVGALTTLGTGAEYSNNDVAQRAGVDLADLVHAGKRDEIMTAMGVGAAHVLKELSDDHRLDGVIGIGGNQGTAIASMAMRSLPFGLPKFLVSTVASGNMRPYVGHKDINVVFSVADLVGRPNSVSRSILRNAMCALIGMVEHGIPVNRDVEKRTVALSALGNTEPAAHRITERLLENGLEVITFHASGAGGSAMEELIDAGVFSGIIDLTPHELSEEVVGAGAYVPVVPGRMNAAARAGIPQVISTGALEYLCFGPRESIPQSMRKRKIYMHNPFNANVKVTQKEMSEIGKTMAARINESRGPVTILVPKRGWSTYGSEGGAFYDPKGYQILLTSLRRGLKPGIDYQELDFHINDTSFADSCADALLAQLSEDIKR
ncbi:MAG: Tm-1-like ATP-binding domain-containing protein [Desulfobacterales bacterium]|nr:Tm-1-like ATP-binding domain-containing protein [Desulfobacterales bacterium]